MSIPRYRIGNDLSVLWAVNNRDGSPYNLDGKEVHLFVTNDRGRYEVPVIIETLEDGTTNNVVRWDFRGEQQRVLGTYTLTLEITNTADSKEIKRDKSEAFSLVCCSESESIEDGEPNIQDGGELILATKLDIYRFGVAKIEIGVNGNWFIDGVDTGRPSFAGEGLVNKIYKATDFGRTFAEDSKIDTFNAYAINSLFLGVSKAAEDIADLYKRLEGGGVINKDFADRLDKLEKNQFFERYDDQTIKTKYNLFSDHEISAFGLNVGTGGGSGGEGGASYLKDLWDVTIVSAANDDILVYNGTHWVNKPQSSIMPDLSVLNNYLLKTEAAELYLVKDAAKDFASTSSVTDLSNALVRLSEAYGNRLNALEKIVQWFHLTQDEQAIYTEKNFYSEKEISAHGLNLGGGSGEGGAIELGNIIGVSLHSPVTGDVFVYNGTHWTNVSQSELVPDLSGYATTDSVSTVSNKVKSLEDRLNVLESEKFFFKLEGADDVIYTPHNLFSEKEISAHGLNYGSGSGASGLLTDLLDVKAENSTSGDLLVFDGTHWINTPQSAIVPSIDTSVIATREWVGQNYASTSDLSNGVKDAKAYTDALRRHVNEQDQIISGQISKILDWFTLEDGVLLTKYNLASEKEVSAKGINASQGGGSSYNRLDSWSAYDNSKAGYILSALLGYDLHTRVTNLENAEVDLSDYYTKSQTNSQIASAIGAIDLSPYATKEALNTLEGKHNILRDEFNALSNLLSSDTTDYINTWNEVVAFLDGYKDESDLATILSGMNADISSRLLASDFESWKTNTFTPLANLVANHTTRLDGLDQSILSINTRIDGVDKTIEDHIAEFIAFRANFEISDDLILVRKNFASTEEVSAKGINQGTGGGGGSSYSRLDTWDGYDNNKAGYVLSAGLGYGLKVAIDELNGYNLNTRVQNIENSYVSKDAGGVVNGGLVVSSLAVAGGSSSQFLKADGSLDSTSYLSTEGGTLHSNSYVVLRATSYFYDNGDAYSRIYIAHDGVDKAFVGWDTQNGTILYNSSGKYLGIKDDGTPYYYSGQGAYNTLLHTGNFNPSGYLPLSGGTLSRSGRDVLTIDTSDSYGPMYQLSVKGKITGAIGHIPSESMGDYGLFISNADANTALLLASDRELYFSLDASRLTKDYTLIHSGNIGEYAGIYSSSVTIDLNEIRDGFRAGKLYNSSNAANAPAAYRGFLEYGTAGFVAQFNSDDQNNLFYRWCENGTWLPWKTIAFTDSDITGNAGGLMTGASHLYAQHNDTDKYIVFGYQTARNGYSTTIDGTNITFRDGGSNPTMLINSSGNILIGTTTDRGHRLAIGRPDGAADLTSTTLNNSLLFVGMSNSIDSYGTNFWTEGSGNGFIQQGRTDEEQPSLYNLCLQPFGGNVFIGTTTDNGSGAKLQVESANNMALSIKGTTYPEASIRYEGSDGKVWTAGKGIMGNGDSFGFYSVTAGRDIVTFTTEGAIINGTLNAGATTLSSLYVSSDIVTNRIIIGGVTLSTEDGVLKIESDMYATGEISAHGLNKGESGGGGSSYSRLDTWIGYDSSKAGYVLSAGLGYDLKLAVDELNSYNLNSRLATVESNYLSKNGGTINGYFGAFSVKRYEPYSSAIKFENSVGILGYIGISDDYTPLIWDKDLNTRTLLHSGNVGDYALKTDGSNVMMGNIRTHGYLEFLNESNSTIGVYNVNAGNNTPIYLYNGAWKTIAFTDSDITGNAGSATKLATPRTIWGQSFDGTGNVDGVLYMTNDSPLSPNFSNAGVLGFDSNTLYLGYSNVGFNTTINGRQVSIQTSDGVNVGERMLINSYGNVTIGATDLASSSTKLHVDGSLSAGDTTLSSLTVSSYVEAKSFSSSATDTHTENGIARPWYGLSVEDAYYNGVWLSGYTNIYLKTATTMLTLNQSQFSVDCASYLGGNTSIVGGLSVSGTGFFSNHVTLGKELFLSHNNAIRNKTASGKDLNSLFAMGESLYVGYDADEVNIKNGTLVLTSSGVTANTSATIAALTVNSNAMIGGDLNATYLISLGATLEYVELSHATPYIDFHYGKDANDYTLRLIESTKGQLDIVGAASIQTKLYVGGDATLHSGLLVGGASTLASLTVTNGATVGSLTSNGTLGVSGLSTLTGGIATNDIHGNGQSLYLGNASNNAYIKVREDMQGSSSMWSIPRDGKAVFTSLKSNTSLEVVGDATMDNATINAVATAKRLVVGTDGMLCNAPATFNDFIYGSSITPRTDNYYVLGNNNYKWYAVTAYNVNVHDAITIEAGKELRFKDDDGMVHTLKYDSTKQAFVFDGNVNATGEMSALTINA